MVDVAVGSLVSSLSIVALSGVELSRGSGATS